MATFLWLLMVFALAGCGSAPRRAADADPMLDAGQTHDQVYAALVRGTATSRAGQGRTLVEQAALPLRPRVFGRTVPRAIVESKRGHPGRGTR